MESRSVLRPLQIDKSSICTDTSADPFKHSRSHSLDSLSFFLALLSSLKLFFSLLCPTNLSKAYLAVLKHQVLHIWLFENSNHVIGGIRAMVSIPRYLQLDPSDINGIGRRLQLTSSTATRDGDH